MNRKIGIVLIVLGLGMFSYSLTLDGFTNRQEFEDNIYNLMDSENKSEKFYKLRESYLTPKFSLENYGLVSMILGLYLITLFPQNGFRFKIPKSKLAIGIIGFSAVLLTTGGYVGDLFLEMHRYRYPPWADSLAIPLMSVPGIFLILLCWFALNLTGLIKPFELNSELNRIDFKNVNYWYLGIFCFTVIITLILIWEGDFWWTAAGIMWLYFYLLLMIGRQNGKLKTNANNA